MSPVRFRVPRIHRALLAGVVLSAFLSLTGGHGRLLRSAERSQNSPWPEGKTYDLKGLRVTLSAPVLVGRSKTAFNFPKIVGLRNGDLIAHVEVTPENWEGEQNEVLWSSDGGLTWGGEARCPIATSARVLLPSGDFVLLPYRLYPRPEGMGGPYCLSPAANVRFAL
jgi:hypothetical protein